MSAIDFRDGSRRARPRARSTPLATDTRVKSRGVTAMLPIATWTAFDALARERGIPNGALARELIAAAVARPELFDLARATVEGRS